MACRDCLIGFLLAAVDDLVLRPMHRLGAQRVDVGDGPDAQSNDPQYKPAGFRSALLDIDGWHQL